MTTLPDLCLLLILHHLPVEDLLRIDQVCSRWRHLKPLICRHRRYLYCLIGRSMWNTEFRKQHRENRLNFRILGDRKAETIATIFPVIKALHINAPSITSIPIESSNGLLAWTNHLVSLELDMAASKQFPTTTVYQKAQYQKLISWINSMPCLRRLALRSAISVDMPLLQLTIIPQLEKFSLLLRYSTWTGLTEVAELFVREVVSNGPTVPCPT